MGQSPMDVMVWVNTTMVHWLGRWGLLVAQRPHQVRAASVVVMLVLASGWSQITTEARGYKLWIPQHTSIMRSRHWHAGLFPQHDELTVLVTAKDGVANVLRPEVVDAVFEIDATVRSLAVSVAVGEGVGVGAAQCTYDDCLCEGQACASGNNVLTLWCDRAQFQREVMDSTDPQEALDARTAPAAHQFCDGELGSPWVTFGSPTLDEGDGRVTAAMAFRLSYPFDSSLRWAHMARDAVLQAGQQSALVRLDVEYANALDEEMDRVIAADMPLVVSCFVLMTALLFAFTYRRDPVERMWSLPLPVMTSIMFAMVSGYGLAMALGWPFTTLQQSLPFIIIAIGIDDMLVLIETMEEVKKEHPQLQVEQQVERTVRHAGMSITITSLTNALAFALGRTSSIPALQGFGVYASLTILFDYFFQLSFFLSCMVLVQQRIRRRDAGRCKCLTACLSGPTLPSSAPKSVCLTAPRPVWVLWTMPVKYGVLAVAVAGAAASLGFIGSLEEGMQLRDLVTKDSFFHRFQTTMERTYGSYMGPPSSLYFHQLNHSDPDAQLRMLSARHYLLTSSQYVSAEFTSSTHWLSALLALDTSLLQPCALLVSDATLCNTPYAPEQLLPAEHFYPLLRQMLQANTLNVAKQLSLDADGAVVASEFQYIHRDVSVSDTGRVFDEAQAIQKHINTQLLNKKHDASPVDAQQEEAVLYSEYLLFGQSNTVLWKETVQNLSLAAAGVLVLALVLLVHPLMLIPVALVLFFVNGYLFGEMLVLGIPFNNVSVIILVMAVGLSVDYSVHVMHSFLSEPGADRSLRAYEALRGAGRPVMMGAATTLMGVSLLAAGSSFIFLTKALTGKAGLRLWCEAFFKLLFGTAVFAAISGLVLVPIWLSLAGPPPIFAHEGTPPAPSKQEDSTLTSAAVDLGEMEAHT